jgi:wyosine [tRNA(Phe)-imidazoG37] synthetase (radical SAM superfamily)
MLFDKIIFGPVRSRRFGVSLGINLIPTTRKICTFDCIYCECGWTDDTTTSHFPTRAQVSAMLQQTLEKMKQQNETPDSITFSGNGEPTLHPEFASIISDTITLRNQYFPAAVITVLSNSTTLDNESVFEALKKIDNNTMKLDAGTEKTFRQIDRCFNKNITLNHITDNLCRFQGNLIIQTLFLKGDYNGEYIDNTSETEISEWLKRIERIRPRKALLYPIDRATPAKNLEYIARQELEIIAEKVRSLNIETHTFD